MLPTGHFSNIHIIALPREFLPLASLDAVVVEEDTALTLTAEPRLEPVAETYETLIRDALQARGRRAGSIIVEEGAPLRLRAVVYDFEREPPWRERWIERALHKVLEEAERRGLRTLALPMLGALPGCMGRERFAPLLRRALKRMPPRRLRTIWLIVPGSADQRLLRTLGVLNRTGS